MIAINFNLCIQSQNFCANHHRGLVKLSALHVKDLGVPLQRSQDYVLRYADNCKRSPQRIDHESSINDVMFKDFNCEETQCNLRESCVLSLERVFPGKWKRRPRPSKWIWNESWCFDRPSNETSSKFSPQEILFCNHDAFVIECKCKNLDNREPPNERQDHRPKTDQKIPQI